MNAARELQEALYVQALHWALASTREALQGARDSLAAIPPPAGAAPLSLEPLDRALALAATALQMPRPAGWEDREAAAALTAAVVAAAPDEAQRAERVRFADSLDPEAMRKALGPNWRLYAEADPRSRRAPGQGARPSQGPPWDPEAPCRHCGVRPLEFHRPGCPARGEPAR